MLCFTYKCEHSEVSFFFNMCLTQAKKQVRPAAHAKDL